MQVLGYAARIWAHYYTNKLAPNIIASCLIVLAPIFYAASIHMCLSRIIRSSNGAHLSILQPRWITRIFLAGDLIALNVQGNGAGLTVNDDPKLSKAGQGIVIGGLAVQIVVFFFYIGVASVWHKRMSVYVKQEQQVGEETEEGRGEIPDLPPWRSGLLMLYSCSALIMVRSVFRLIEYIQGPEGFLLGHEWPLYTFDTAPMLVVQIIYVIWFPGEFKAEMGERRKRWMRLLRKE